MSGVTPWFAVSLRNLKLHKVFQSLQNLLPSFSFVHLVNSQSNDLELGGIKDPLLWIQALIWC